MEDVFIISENIITSLGFTTEENLSLIKSDNTGIQLREDVLVAPDPFYASMIDRGELGHRFSQWGNPEHYSHFEQLVICSLHDALSFTSVDPASDRTLFILSTTKGNIELLKQSDPVNTGLYLWQSGEKVRSFFGFINPVLVISNACISGLMALIVAARHIRSGMYDHVIVTGADVISEFIYSGFNSFMSLSQGPCRPFDLTRDGLSLGEGAGTMILTPAGNLPGNGDYIRVGTGFSTNDANHISGPSRTGEGLYTAIQRTMEQAGTKVDFISAHGTATPYNDEMEAIAITRAGLQHVPVNSMKGYWGHTLGAAGIIESVAAVYSLQNQMLIGTKGYKEPGVSRPIHVINQTGSASISSCLKLASGFGGCNAALMFYK